jgi:hypothetical protein
MFFLAVTLGFFSEQIRKKLFRKKRARDLAIAMIEDQRKDVAQLHKLLIGEKNGSIGQIACALLLREIRVYREVVIFRYKTY